MISKAPRKVVSISDSFSTPTTQGKITPDSTQNELNVSVRLTDLSQTDSDSRLANKDCPDMMQNSDRRKFRAIDEFEDVHSNQHLRNNDKHITKSDWRARRERRLESSFSEGDTDERVCGDDQNDNFRDTGDMVIDETATIQLAHICINGSIKAADEEAFEDIEANQEEDNEGDGDDEG